MKTTLLTTMLIATVSLAIGQNQMTIAHTGLAPTNVLNVEAGDTIEFIYGSGGSHPMTEGWPNTGEASYPQPFVTQTVTASNPSKLFTLEVEGTYFFHCGSNPTRTANYGKIVVGNGGSPAGVENHEVQQYHAYPNPVIDVVTVEEIVGTAVIVSINGKTVMTMEGSSADVSQLPSGIYFVESEEGRTKFIKK